MLKKRMGEEMEKESFKKAEKDYKQNSDFTGDTPEEALKKKIERELKSSMRKDTEVILKSIEKWKGIFRKTVYEKVQYTSLDKYNVCIQPIRSVYKFGDASISSKNIGVDIEGHISQIIIFPKKKIAYYIDSDWKEITAKLTVNFFSDGTEGILVDELPFFEEVREALGKYDISLQNMSEMVKFCPYTKKISHTGSQVLNKDSQCQTWYVYNSIMFILNPDVPVSVILETINENYSDRLAQFTNWIYETYVR